MEKIVLQEAGALGIGSAIVRIMLGHLKENGITEVSGKISPVDAHNHGGFKKVSGFWKKNGFTVISYGPDDRTRWVARIVCVLTCHRNYH
jgi:GNAT superfamily N-acetyltransferase